MNRYRVAHYISKYLSIPENWIYKILTNQEKYEPIMFTRKRENRDLYPIDFLFSLDDFFLLRQFFELLFFKSFGYFFFIQKVCKRYEVKILHIHFGYHGIKMMRLKDVLSVPMICSFYGDDAFAFPMIKSNHDQYRQLFKVADKILVLGPYMKKSLINLGCEESKILIHHLGIETRKIKFQQRVISRGEGMKFLIASSFVEKKGIDVALKALASLKTTFVFSLDIVGDGILKNEILSEIDRLQLGDRITMHGYKPYDFFIELAYGCHVFIQASRTGKRNTKEGTPMAIVDAMATGMPIISTNHSDIPEIVTDGVNGYLAQENDVNSLATCLRKILEEPEKIPYFGRNGRLKVEQDFNIEIQVKKLEEIYMQLLQ